MGEGIVRGSEIVTHIPLYLKWTGLPGGPGVRDRPCCAGEVGSIPGRGTKIPHAAGLSLRATSREGPARRNQTQHSHK